MIYRHETPNYKSREDLNLYFQKFELGYYGLVGNDDAKILHYLTKLGDDEKVF